MVRFVSSRFDPNERDPGSNWTGVWMCSTLSGQFGEYLNPSSLQPIEAPLLGRPFCSVCTVSTFCSVSTISNSAQKKLYFKNVNWSWFWINRWWHFNVWDLRLSGLWNFLFVIFPEHDLTLSKAWSAAGPCWDCGFESCGHGILSLVGVVFCQVEFSASGLSLVQRNSTDCGASYCDHEASIMRMLWPQYWLLRHWCGGRDLYWVMVICRLVGWYKGFGDMRCFHLPGRAYLPIGQIAAWLLWHWSIAVIARVLCQETGRISIWVVVRYRSSCHHLTYWK